jgi:hypothetical protein
MKHEIKNILFLMGLSQIAINQWMLVPLPLYGGQTPTDIIVKGNGQKLIDDLINLAIGNV